MSEHNRDNDPGEQILGIILLLLGYWGGVWYRGRAER